MAVQITKRQISNNAVDVSKLDLSTGTFDFTSAVLQVAAPTQGSHAATKTYVDSIAQGLQWKASVKVATTGNITLSGTQTIDGISVVADDRVLVKDQTDKTENGIYVCKAGSWVRADDMDAASEFAGAAVFIQEGSDNADTGYVCINDGSVVIGTDDIEFVQFTGAGQLAAGNGIDITASTISVALAASNAGLEFNSGLQVKLQDKKGLVSQADGLAVEVGNGIEIDVASGAVKAKINATNASLVSDSNGLAVKLDAAQSILSKAANGLKIADNSITATQIAANAVTSSELASGSVSTAKLAFESAFQAFDADGSTLAFELSTDLNLNFKYLFVVTVNGLVMEYKDTPDAQDNYKIDNSGAGGVGRIVFGSNLSNGDRVTVRYFYDA